MLFTLASVVFLASIAVFFAQEFIRFIKKVFAIKGVKLFLPLLIASWLIYTFDFWALWIIYYCREVLSDLLVLLMKIIPLHGASRPVALIVLLTMLSVVPVFLIDAYSRQRTYKAYKYPNVTSAVIWIVCAVLLLVL